MGTGPPPELEVARVERWCREQVPAAVRDALRIECEISGRDNTIVERRPPWNGQSRGEWMSTPVARLRHLKSRSIWRLYWRGRDGRWRECPSLPYAASVDQLLEELERDQDALFWG
ncbi:DUF3024 domain-containing protein [Blastococcus saxobsidens]|nr:DUF3024 domain-containing protein [Blastococcus saxobsidens]